MYVCVCKRRGCIPFAAPAVVNPTRAKREGRRAQVHACTFDRDRYAARCCEEKEPVAFIVQGQHTLARARLRLRTNSALPLAPFPRSLFLFFFFLFTLNPSTFSCSRQNASASIRSLKRRSMVVREGDFFIETRINLSPLGEKRGCWLRSVLSKCET